MNTLRTYRNLLAAFALTLATFGLFQPAAQAQSYLDIDGFTAGFQAIDGTTYSLNDSVWNPDPSGIGTQAAFVAGSGITVGSVANEFAGQSFSISTVGVNSAFGSITINSGTVTLIGAFGGNNHPGSPWTVATGSTLNQNNDYNGNVGMNWQGAAVTLQGGGTMNFNKMLGFNSGGRITEDDGGAGLVVNLKAAGSTVSVFSGGYRLTSGKLNFATAASATAFRAFNTANRGFEINGGTLDNTSGSAMTLTVGTTGYSIGGDFTFTGSSDLNFGTAPVVLTATPQITVGANTLTIGGIISGSGFGLTKAGNGTLTLNGVNTYDGPTIVSAGTFGGSGTIGGAATFDAGTKAVFKVTPGGPGNNSTLMTITGVMTFNANVVHLNLPANLPGGTYVLAASSATPVANGAFPTPVVDSGSYAGDVTGATITMDTVTKQLILTAVSGFTGPVRLAITQVNGGANPTAGTPFSVVVQAQNGSGVAKPVSADTAVTLSLKTGTDTLGGTLSGTILAGQNQVTITGVTYSKAQGGVVLEATRTSGDSLTPGDSAAFTVNPGAVSATASTVIASLGGVPADGATPITITVTLWDGFGNPVPGKTVTLASSRGGTDTISPDPGISDANGVVTFTVTSSTAGTATLSATDVTDSNLHITQTATVVFAASNPNLVIGEEQLNVSSDAPYAGPPAPIDVVNDDLLEMPGVVPTGGDGFSQPESWMRNGLFTDPNQLYQKSANNPLVMTYALDLTDNILGYDIKEIRMFGNPYQYRSGQSYDIFYSLVGAPDAFILLGTVSTPVGEYGALMTRTYDSRSGATPDAGPAILSGVAKIRFNFRIVQDGIIWREFDATGSATVAGTTAPTVTGITTDGLGNVVVHGTTAGAAVITEKTTNLADGPSGWTPVSTNDVTGGVFEIPIPQGTDPRAFFRVKNQ